MNHWMTCTTCKAIVQLNATGTCLGCQGGFNPCNKEDKYKPEEEEEMKKKTKSEKKISKVMGEYKEGELHSGSKKGPKVKTPKQAIAIALSEAKKGKK